MKIFENKKIWKKVVIMLLLIIFFQFGFATPVKAGDDGNGGILTGPIVVFIVAVGDRLS